MLINMTTLEVELARDALNFWCDELNTGLASEAHRAAGRFVLRNAETLIAKLERSLAQAKKVNP